MTANPIPGLQLPYPQTPTQQQNLQELQRWAKTISPRMLAIDTSGLLFQPISYGGNSPPEPPSDSYLMIAGSQDVTFVHGRATLTFPKPFPNGILAVTAMFNDDSHIIGQALSPTPTQVSFASTTSSFGPVPCAYIAIGW